MVKVAWNTGRGGKENHVELEIKIGRYNVLLKIFARRLWQENVSSPMLGG